MAGYGSIEGASVPEAKASGIKKAVAISAAALAGALLVAGQGSTMLAQKSMGFIPLQPAGSMGTNRAFLGKYDGVGQSTKGQLTMLAQGADKQPLPYVPVPDYSMGGIGTNTAFLGAHDGEHVTSARKYKKMPTGATRFGTDAVFGGAKAAVGQKLLVNSFQVTKDNHIQAQAPRGYGNQAANEQFAPPNFYSQQKSTKQNLFGTDKAFMGKYDGKGQSTKARPQQLYEWDASMEGEYLAPSPVLTGEGTNQASLVAPPFQNAFTDETNLGGIPGKEPANILYPGIY